MKWGTTLAWSMTLVIRIRANALLGHASWLLLAAGKQYLPKVIYEVLLFRANSTTFWSDCSLEYLQHALKRGVDYCLQNVPKTAFGGAKC